MRPLAALRMAYHFISFGRTDVIARSLTFRLCHDLAGLVRLGLRN